MPSHLKLALDNFVVIPATYFLQLQSMYFLKEKFCRIPPVPVCQTSVTSFLSSFKKAKVPKNLSFKRKKQDILKTSTLSASNINHHWWSCQSEVPAEQIVTSLQGSLYFSNIHKAIFPIGIHRQIYSNTLLKLILSKQILLYMLMSINFLFNRPAHIRENVVGTFCWLMLLNTRHKKVCSSLKVRSSLTYKS